MAKYFAEIRFKFLNIIKKALYFEIIAITTIHCAFLKNPLQRTFGRIMFSNKERNFGHPCSKMGWAFPGLSWRYILGIYFWRSCKNTFRTIASLSSIPNLILHKSHRLKFSEWLWLKLVKHCVLWINFFHVNNVQRLFLKK